MEPQKKPKRNASGNWIGIVIFILVIAGPQIANVLSNLVSSVSGGAVTLSPNTLIPLLILGAVLISALVGIGRAISSAGDTRTGPSASKGPWAPPSAPQRSASPGSPAQRPSAPMPPRNFPPTSSSPKSPSSSQPGRQSSDLRPGNLPGPPRFEPIIDPRVLSLGLAGLLVFAVIFGALFVFAGTMP
jgi:hypothetical protein